MKTRYCLALVQIMGHSFLQHKRIYNVNHFLKLKNESLIRAMQTLVNAHGKSLLYIMVQHPLNIFFLRISKFTWNKFTGCISLY